MMPKIEYFDLDINKEVPGSIIMNKGACLRLEHLAVLKYILDQIQSMKIMDTQKEGLLSRLCKLEEEIKERIYDE